MFHSAWPVSSYRHHFLVENRSIQIPAQEFMYAHMRTGAGWCEKAGALAPGCSWGRVRTGVRGVCKRRARAGVHRVREGCVRVREGCRRLCVGCAKGAGCVRKVRGLFRVFGGRVHTCTHVAGIHTCMHIYIRHDTRTVMLIQSLCLHVCMNVCMHA